ncbi:OmpA family protein [Burkholderia ubonensis]|uniref:OmpA family protein n=1 Tax=Burkholderia ubonensis TaxID=101571 RepID=UPI00075ED6D5|nr:OmpA family protein [Burkholderia ubonensis]KVQ05119.1 flagellar motor protein MotB [Burkholderia ubonensis]
MKGIQTIKHVALASAMLLGLAASPAFAQYQTDDAISVAAAGTQAGKVFGMSYAPVGQVAADQVQIVYYRSQAMGNGKAANVYVDGHYQTSLLPNGYTTFCVQPGNHTLGAYLNDAPQYRGKTTNQFQADLKAGATYFLKAQEGGNGAPVAVSREQAERELQGARAQVHALSRAATTVSCNVSAPVAAPQYKDYTLQSDVLFAFGKSGYRDINVRGREEIGRLIEQMRREHTDTKQITVVGHADQIGSDAAADKLGLARAQTVRSMLIERGIPASRIAAETAGNTEPVVNDCGGTRQQQIACYAPNRRVVVRADMSGVN